MVDSLPAYRILRRTRAVSIRAAIVAFLGLAALAPRAGLAQSTYLSGEDDQTFRTLEQAQDPAVVHAARAQFERLEQALNNHDPLDEIVVVLRETSLELATEWIALDEGCVSHFLGRMAEVTAYEFDDRILEDSARAEVIQHLTVSLLEAAAVSYRTATEHTDSACLIAATAAAERRPAPEEMVEPSDGSDGRPLRQRRNGRPRA